MKLAILFCVFLAPMCLCLQVNTPTCQSDNVDDSMLQEHGSCVGIRCDPDGTIRALALCQGCPPGIEPIVVGSGDPNQDYPLCCDFVQCPE